jgi:hypothetical protein
MMNQLLLLGILVLGLRSLAVAAPDSDALSELDRCNVVWDSPSENSHGSMPLGNGDIGLNAWVEPSGDLVFYISKTNAWDENGRLCKVGRVRVTCDPPLATGPGFRQELKLRNGCVEIKGADHKIALRLWVDANHPTVNIEAESETPVNCRAEVELWRLAKRPFISRDDCHSGNGLENTSFKPTLSADVVVPGKQPRVIWYHRNPRSVVDLCLEVQHLNALKGKFPDPLLNLTFGACLSGVNCVRDGDKAVKSAAPAKHHALAVTVLAANTKTEQDWLAQLGRLEQARKTPAPRAAHEAWWNAFWQRSWIYVKSADQGTALEQLTQSYVLQRYMNGCAGRGASPIKFNGSIFTVEKSPGPPRKEGSDPDWRQWGSNYWFQNTRLIYWTMLASGDAEMMQPWYNMFLNALPLSKGRVKTYYHFDNAALFPETMYFWGTPNNGDYGYDNKAPEIMNTYTRRHWNGNLELIMAMLDRYDFIKDDEFVRRTLVPLADPILSFYSQYWPKRDSKGKIIFDPDQALEMYPVTTNPMPDVAALHAMLPRLVALPKTLVSDALRARWQKMLSELPPVPLGGSGKDQVLLPAEKFGGAANKENPELYAIFPFRLFTVGRDGLDIARRSYEKRLFRHNGGWCQDSIQAAYLGLGDEAGRQVTARAAQVNKAFRFPVMWGPNFDWIPDQDHGCNILTTMQGMVLQHVGDKIYLLPAWPKGWDASFKLHAPKNTTVEGVVRDGKLASLKVTPKSREADVVNMLDK